MAGSVIIDIATTRRQLRLTVGEITEQFGVIDGTKISGMVPTSSTWMLPTMFNFVWWSRMAKSALTGR